VCAKNGIWRLRSARARIKNFIGLGAHFLYDAAISRQIAAQTSFGELQWRDRSGQVRYRFLWFPLV
jgi:hypothetical protein